MTTPPADDARSAGSWKASDGFYYSADSRFQWDGEKWLPMTAAAPAPRGKLSAGAVVGIAIAGVVGFCLLLGIVGVVFGSSDNEGADSSSNAAADRNTSEEADGSHIGKPRRDGKFEFVVTDITCGKTSVGDQYLNKTSQGQYCFVAMKITNIGDEPRTFSGANQYAFNASGNKYTNDTEAEIYNKSSNSFLENINPGNRVEGTIIFDIPKDQSITKLELHDSSLSGGIDVNVV